MCCIHHPGRFVLFGWAKNQTGVHMEYRQRRNRCVRGTCRRLFLGGFEREIAGERKGGRGDGGRVYLVHEAICRNT